MLGAVCKEVNNWFEQSKLFGQFQISGGTMPVEGGKNGQYVRIVGSTFNDGVHILPLANLKDETFDGAIWLMAVPRDFVALSNEIGKWQQTNGDALSGAFTSESFGGYAYTKKTAQDGSEYGWKDAFASRLNRWRKI
jgi:hypothetical protein